MLSFPIVTASAMKLPDRIAFNILGFDVYWLGLLLAVGVIAAVLFIRIECRRKDLPLDTTVDLCLVALPLGIIGARIAYVLLHLSLFQGRALQTLYLWDGGLSAGGGVILALVGIFVYARKKRIRYLVLLDAMTPGLCVALAISCWGAFFDQTFYGPAVASAALKWFPLCVRLDDGSIHLALFFYLFIWLLLLFVWLWLFLRKRAKHDGDAALSFLLLFSLAFAVLSAFRRDGASAYLAEQIAGAALFFLTLLFLLIRYVREARLGRLMWPAPAEGPPDEDREAVIEEPPVDTEDSVENDIPNENDEDQEDTEESDRS